ncbi:NADPH-dependent 7-cyano-7-deazaguanine reductase QueF [Pseudomarimonas salicorniae]|uniref:NADPH-dependent 7-cyano-7-deazaguanine reductase n=1 Tax=Pseudomarimonas salicorniae TaxID=2933270 RepID=A0ABT0GM20_9GAMM|nr:NADPH-dependent 7-cyano-7-deazaguanine reductase QueF [Lysobacter sp. CAU 1642]MCK7595596.1 NADPH-dependent 7-cyano-7-deazaguanine reductase QueF [Lysobacter sp. CAU 1642]
MPTAADSSLGKTTEYREDYDPALLFPIPRAGNRAALDLAGVPLHGVDVWNAYELSWLAPGGLPRVALAELRVPADSPNLIESKSLKLYLNGFMQFRAEGPEIIRAMIERDLSVAARAPVSVDLLDATQLPESGLPEGDCIDDPAITIDHYGPPDAELLRWGGERAEQRLVSHLLKSNCPVTGQPDWASVQIHLDGPRLDRAALLRYLVGFRRHAEFHEHCVERIFCDLWQRTRPDRLSVYARYTRRGGLDINPFRCSDPQARPDNRRLPRQ